jgi:hypothetical protein
MQEHHSASPTVIRIVTVLAIVSVIGMVGFGVLYWKIEYVPVNWYQESFGFESKALCVAFVEPKFAVFLGDGGTDEVFNRINFYSSGSQMTVNGYGVSSSSSGFFARRTQHGKTTMRFLDGKCTMTLSHRGTKLKLADGREFVLDGQTPLWLRCKSDGTIVQLDELPEGFVEFFESPPPDPGLIGSVKSWPDAFRK